MSSERPNELVRGPKWRTRTTESRRHRAAALTFALVVAIGGGLLAVAAWALARLGASGSIVVLTWLVPTVIVVLWTLLHPTAARLSDDDDDTWFGYAIRWALVGELDPRPAPIRLLVALLTGAPVGWALAVVAVLTLLGIA